jgi:hypothetical protein
MDITNTWMGSHSNSTTMRLDTEQQGSRQEGQFVDLELLPFKGFSFSIK